MGALENKGIYADQKRNAKREDTVENASISVHEQGVRQHDHV